MIKLSVLLILCFLVSACAPEVGTKEWCEDMKQKKKATMSSNESMNFAKHCIFNEPKE